jgi:squalene-hopene/tetraprenyl-beta-curcumene cyclase
MSGRAAFLVSVVPGLAVLLQPAAACGDENTPGQWDRTQASQFLDRRGESWFNFGAAHRGQGPSSTTCVSCHSLLPYALARPVLRRICNESMPTKWETRILEQARRRVSNWDRLSEPTLQLYYDFDEDKKKQSRGTEAILNALILSFDDRLQGRHEPGADTKKALSILWATQITDGQHKGSWEWLNFGTQPWESMESRFMGAALAAIAVGAAPGYSPGGTDGNSRQRLLCLRNYLRREFASQNLHNRVWMLWASSSWDGLLTPRERDQLIEQILEKQQSCGGWSLASLGEFAHGELKNQVAGPDGYATGLILHVLQLAGLPKEHPHVSKGLAWLRANQDPTGAWRAMSMNKKREPESTNPAKAHIGKFMWDAATGYAVLALSH